MSNWLDVTDGSSLSVFQCRRSGEPIHSPAISRLILSCSSTDCKQLWQPLREHRAFVVQHDWRYCWGSIFGVPRTQDFTTEDVWRRGSRNFPQRGRTGARGRKSPSGIQGPISGDEKLGQSVKLTYNFKRTPAENLGFDGKVVTVYICTFTQF